MSHSKMSPVTSRTRVADPGGGLPLPLLKLVKKKMAAALCHKFRESLGPLGQIYGSAAGFNPKPDTTTNFTLF